LIPGIGLEIPFRNYVWDVAISFHSAEHKQQGYSTLSFPSFFGSTAPLKPWPRPQNPAEFLGGFSTIFYFTG
jgi:hypothetical protein